MHETLGSWTRMGGRNAMARREFIGTVSTALLGLAASPRSSGLRAAPAEGGRIMTVGGSVSAETLGTSLSHEHVLVDFIGADQADPSRYSLDAVVDKVLPYVKEVAALGCETLFECTPAYLGRDPRLLRRLSEASGLRLVTNTGYYGARDNKFLPRHGLEESADQLSRRWIQEWEHGIDGTDVRPGFIKIGVGGETLSEVHQKLVRAAARTHRSTGLTIAAHTGKATLALEELAILREEGVAPDAFIWVHAQNEQKVEHFRRAAESGAWVSWDGFRAREATRYVTLLNDARRQGWLHRVLVSHDAGWYRPGEPNGGSFRGFTEIFRVLIPRLLTEGFTEQDVARLMRVNPAEAYSIRKRPL